MKACWKENAQAVVSESQRETFIQSVRVFVIFVTYYCKRAYEVEFFSNFEIRGCIVVCQLQAQTRENGGVFGFISTRALT
jgi:hypothetical protein